MLGPMRRSREDPAQRVQVTASTHRGPQRVDRGVPGSELLCQAGQRLTPMSEQVFERRGVEVVGRGEPSSHGGGVGDAVETALLRPDACESHALDRGLGRHCVQGQLRIFRPAVPANG